jgi:hypothetical protein
MRRQAQKAGTPPIVASRTTANANHQPEISRDRDGEFALAHCLGRVPQCLTDIFGNEIGIAARISDSVIPSATIATTAATGIRNPRMQGTPPIWRCERVTRVNFMSAA